MMAKSIRTCPETALAKTIVPLIFILIISASFSNPIFAARTGSKEITPNLGGFSLSATIGGLSYVDAGTDSRTYSPLYGIKFGYDVIGKSVVSSIGVEGTLNFFNAKHDYKGNDANGYLFRLDAVYPFILSKIPKKIVPFLAVGAGGVITSSEVGYNAFPLLNYGAGVKYFYEEYLALRADARHIIAYDSNTVNTRNNVEFSVGLSYYFDKERKKKPEPVPDAKQKEKDQKGKDKKKNGKAKPGEKTSDSSSAVPRLDTILSESDAVKKSAETAKTPAAQPLSATPPAPASSGAATAPAAGEAPAQVNAPAVASDAGVAPKKAEAVSAPARTEEKTVPAEPPAATVARQQVPKAETPAVPAAPLAVVEPEPAKGEIRRPAPEKEQEAAAAPAPPETVPAPAAAENEKPASPPIAAPMPEAAKEVPVVSPPSALAPAMPEAEPPAKTQAAAPAKPEAAAAPAKPEAAPAPAEVEAIPPVLPPVQATPPARGETVTVPARPEEAGKPEPSKLKEPGVSATAPAATPPAPLPAPAEIQAPAVPAAPPAAAEPEQAKVEIRKPAPEKAQEAAAAPMPETLPAPAAAEKKTAEEPAVPMPEAKKEAPVVSPPSAPAPDLPEAKPSAKDQTAAPAKPEAAPAPAGVEAIPAPAAKAPERTAAAPAPPVQATPPTGVETKPVPARPEVAEQPVPEFKSKDHYTLTTGETINRKKLDPLLNKLKSAGQEAVVRKEIRDTEVYRLISECNNSRKSAIKRQEQLSRWIKDAFVVRDGDSYCVSAGSFVTEDAALREQERITKKGLPVKVVKARVSLPVWRINSGSYADSRQAEEAAKALAAKGIGTAVEKVETGAAEPKARKIRELTVEFDFDRSIVKSEYYVQFKEIVDILKSSPRSSALIEGHTDNVGSAFYNLKLSKRRAESVKSSFVKFGVAPSRISTRGYGLTRPVADNATDEGRQKNRRSVTILLMTD